MDSFHMDEKNKQEKTIVFATSSPRRKQMLHQFGLDFRFVDPIGDERIKHGNESPLEYVQSLATQKARSVFDAVPKNAIIFAADTVVVLGDRVIGKPINRTEAEETLKNLSGSHHQVITAICVFDMAKDVYLEEAVTTKVHMRDYGDGEMRSYVETGDPMDKAGSYAIQNDFFNPVEAIEGCYFSVVGLPICKLLKILTQLKLKTIIDVEKHKRDFSKCTGCLMLSPLNKSQIITEL